jgi:hypothetical protein
VGSWRDIAAAAQRQDSIPAPVDENYGLPDSVAAGLRRLRELPPPRKIEISENWRGVVADALSMARDDWAANAIALGWTVGDLFGVGPCDDWDFQGLAVWLDGWRIVLIDSAQAIAVSTDGERRHFLRGGTRHGSCPTIAPVMLWDFGR